MESSMDFQAAAPTPPGAGGDEAPEPPAMDTEEGPAVRPDAPAPRVGVGQQEEPRLVTLSPNCGSGRDLPAPEGQRRALGPGSGPASASEPGGGAGGRDELCRDLGRETDDEAGAAGPRDSAGWKPSARSTSRGTGHPRDPSSGDLTGMELDEDAEDEPSELQGLLAQLQTLDSNLSDHSPASEQGPLPSTSAGTAPLPALQQAQQSYGQCQGKCRPCPLHVATGQGLETRPCCAQHSACSRPCHGLLFAEADREDLLSLLCYEGGLPEASTETPLARSDILAGTNLEMLQAQEEPAAVETPEVLERPESSEKGSSSALYCREGLCEVDSTCEGHRDASPEPDWVTLPPTPAPEAEQPPQGSVTNREPLSSCSAFKEVPGPCDPEDLLDGVIFGAKYLGSTQLVSERNPPTSVRMAQAQEAVDRIKAPEGESQPMTEVDLFVSTQRIKVLTADTQEAMMDHSLQTISYIADIGSLVVLMARRKLPQRSEVAEEKRLYKMICHVFHSADAQVIAQAIGQAFGVAYQRFLEANSIDPSELSPRQYSRALEDQEQYNAELTHFSRQENCKDVFIRKQKGEILGIAIVESGWGSILPTVVIANLMHGGPAERSGELSIGDRLMSVNGTSLVGLPLTSCQSIIRELKHQTEVTLNIVHCPPVTTAVIRRPDSKYQLGFCVENGVICSLMRGGIAERGGIRVGHRIIEINGQSVVATPHEKIIQILTQAVSEVHIKTMPASTYRLLTGQEQPIFL
ncbi:PREDICTED: amyloid beta A4 precursor protein-binding family A member 3 isoform X2 [Calidris pugnax]|uniref:amyloid beta A4 precursor protein-binding family A member 3 isoform X1 n=1 Tax=Calidris pugnax TaxID=198806 RepID=UPI00071D7501|nr:PREDICTED: amyloid beta A4 precursor protein-binding family A member 3 isoform X1 [Calidris pugnax]XP_014804535.1 PREDICTED: amyloid beta A4 precursor protein-binding family A member 3 isoform X2 [Calidris pugnax]